MKPPLLTCQQVADRLQVSLGTVYTLADRGDLPVIWIRSRRRFDPDDIEEWIENKKRTSRPWRPGG